VADKQRQYLLLADEGLMSLASDGDAGAFVALYDRHGWAACSLAYRMVGEQRAAEGLVREEVMEALRVLPSEQLKVLQLAYFSGYTHGDSRSSRPSARDRKGSHEPGIKKDSGTLQLSWDEGVRMSEA
jgi:DNA-directed RNA polymerase specialized sigma24 family protein